MADLPLTLSCNSMGRPLELWWLEDKGIGKNSIEVMNVPALGFHGRAIFIFKIVVLLLIDVLSLEGASFS